MVKHSARQGEQEQWTKASYEQDALEADVSAHIRTQGLIQGHQGHII